MKHSLLRKKLILIFMLIFVVPIFLLSCEEYFTVEEEETEDVTDNVSVVESSLETVGTTEKAGTSNMRPSVEIIEVYDEVFSGIFTDIANNGYQEAIEALVEKKFITCKINPKDEKNKFYPDVTIKRVEAAAMLINAFSEDKIDPHEEDWETVVFNRVYADEFPVSFLKIIGDDVANATNPKSAFNKDITSREAAVLIVFCIEKYTGEDVISSYTSKNWSTMTFEGNELNGEGVTIEKNAKGIITGIKFEDFFRESIVPKRCQFAYYLYQYTYSLSTYWEGNG